MSHHVHMLPGIIPVDRPAASGKKRRLRKARASAIGGITSLDDEDDDFYLSADGLDDERSSSPLYGDSGTSGRFSSETMKALLEVQEQR